MKIRIIFFLLILILIPKTSFCQEKMKLIDIGGKVIWIPAPENDMSEIGDSLRKLLFEVQVPPGNILKAVFLPNDVISKLGIEPASDGKKLIIEIVKSLEEKDISENDFKETVSYMKKSFSSDLPVLSQKVNKEFDKIKDRIGKQEIGKMEILGTVIDSKDAFAYLMSFKMKDDNNVKMYYAGLLAMRVKNRMMMAYFYNYADYEESINWIANIIPIWSKKVFELNQEISSKSNGNSSVVSSNEEVNNSNSSQVNKKSDNPVINLLSPIYELFRDLLLKAPLTFICLVILIIAYFRYSRIWYHKYKASKSNQQSAYEKYIKSKNPSKNGALWATLFILELFVIAFIFLNILKLIGFTVPKGLL